MEVGRGPAGQAESVRAHRAWWDAQAVGYQREHGGFLTGFTWGPEGLREDNARLLGDVSGRRVLEVGCGAAQCGAWLAARGADVIAVDLSLGMLRHAARPPGLRLVQADACRLPLRDGSVDAAFSSYGAVPFVADSAGLMAEVARVVRPGGRWVFSLSHPVRWALPDDPGPAGLTVRHSYFDRTPYVERDGADRVTYAEHHRTLGDRVRELVSAGFELVDLVEPEWPDGHETTWGGWSPLRGRLVPGTAVLCSRRR